MEKLLRGDKVLPRLCIHRPGRELLWALGSPWWERKWD